jgi:hypothetical protein
MHEGLKPIKQSYMSGNKGDNNQYQYKNIIKTWDSRTTHLKAKDNSKI